MKRAIAGLIASLALIGVASSSYAGGGHGRGHGGHRHGGHGHAIHGHHGGVHHHHRHHGFRGSHHHHHSFFSGAFIIGAPFAYGYHHYHPWSYPASPPVVYIERSEEQPYWYYCTSPEGYHPYIDECPSGWRLVPQTPPR